jgi:hypothetical protein
VDDFTKNMADFKNESSSHQGAMPESDERAVSMGHDQERKTAEERDVHHPQVRHTHLYGHPI